MNAKLQEQAQQIPVIGGMQRALLYTDVHGVLRVCVDNEGKELWSLTPHATIKDWLTKPERGVQRIEHVAKETYRTEGLENTEVFAVFGPDWEILIAVKEG